MIHKKDNSPPINMDSLLGLIYIEPRRLNWEFATGVVCEGNFKSGGGPEGKPAIPHKPAKIRGCMHWGIQPGNEAKKKDC